MASITANGLWGRPFRDRNSATDRGLAASQTLLADRGQHRGPSVPDLIVGAAAELGGLTVLHLDKDFDLIAEVTGQPMERLTITG